MQNPVTQFTKLPPAAKFAVVGVVGGAALLGYKRSRDAQYTESSPDVTDTSGEPEALPNGSPLSGAGGIVVVSPSNPAPATSTDSAGGIDFATLQAGFLGGFSRILDTADHVVTTTTNQNDRLVGGIIDSSVKYDNAMSAIINAGSAAPTEPAQVQVNYVPVPVAAPVPTPPAPVAVPAFDPTYGGKFTHKNNATGQYYRIEYDSKTRKTYHIYADGRKVLDK